LGNPPEWLNDEDVSLSTVRDLIKQVKGYSGNNSSKADFLIRRATDEFSQALKSFGVPLDKPVDGDLLLKRIDATKPLRDYFFDYIEASISKDMPVGEIASNYFENLYNNVTTDTRNLTSYYPDNLEIYHYFIWESFICTITILLHYEKYEEIKKMLVRTYFLYDRSYGEIAHTFIEFENEFRVIEEISRNKYANQQLFTLAGEIAVKREKKPIITKETIVNADLILYQMSCVFESDKYRRWFPILYVYHSWPQHQIIWKRLVSKKHCEKLFPLFGVSSIIELKKLIGKCTYDHQYRHNNAREAAPNILSSIKLEEIGVLN
jgi:hypothetical protein